MRGLGFAIAGFELGMVFEAFLRMSGHGTTANEGYVKIVLALLGLLVLSASREREIGF